VKLTTQFHLVPKSKNVWSYTSIPQYALMAWCLVKHRENFTLLIIEYSSVSLLLNVTYGCESISTLQRERERTKRGWMHKLVFRLRGWVSVPFACMQIPSSPSRQGGV